MSSGVTVVGVVSFPSLSKLINWTFISLNVPSLFGFSYVKYVFPSSLFSSFTFLTASNFETTISSEVTVSEASISAVPFTWTVILYVPVSVALLEMFISLSVVVVKAITLLSFKILTTYAAPVFFSSFHVNLPVATPSVTVAFNSLTAVAWLALSLAITTVSAVDLLPYLFSNINVTLADAPSVNSFEIS